MQIGPFSVRTERMRDGTWKAAVGIETHGHTSSASAIDACLESARPHIGMNAYARMVAVVSPGKVSPDFTLKPREARALHSALAEHGPAIVGGLSRFGDGGTARPLPMQTLNDVDFIEIGTLRLGRAKAKALAVWMSVLGVETAKAVLENNGDVLG